MSVLATLSEELIACTKATLAIIEGDDPQLSDIALRVQERSDLFAKLAQARKTPEPSENVRLLTQLANALQPIDAKILAWMQANQDAVAEKLRKVQRDRQPDTRAPSEARILIQDA